MTTIIIRLKSLLLFGVLLLLVSFLSVGVKAYLDKNDAPVIGEEGLNEQEAEPADDKTVTIVAQEQPHTEKDSFFSEYRIERERTRGESVEILREIVNNPNSAAEMRAEAQRKLIKISDDLEKEAKIENSLRAKGFADAIAVIEPGSVMVIVPAENIKEEEIVRIADVVVKVANCKPEDVIIVPKT